MHCTVEMREEQSSVQLGITAKSFVCRSSVMFEQQHSVFGMWYTDFSARFIQVQIQHNHRRHQTRQDAKAHQFLQ